MSVTMNVKIELHDRTALEKACARLNIPLKQGEFGLYSSVETGLGIFLPGWKYPVVLKDNNTLSYDNYNGDWGDIQELNKLKAYYGIEKAKIEARKKGYSIYETINPYTQDLELQIQM